MATKHICDRCGAEVKTRADFWEVAISRVEKNRLGGVDSMFGKGERDYERWELCDCCKKHVYIALHEVGDAK